MNTRIATARLPLRITALILLLTFGAVPTSIAAQIQRSFASPDEAVTALVEALKTDKTEAMRAVLGPGSDALIQSGDRVADTEARHRFLVAYDEQHKLVSANPDKMILDVGQNHWPLPIPLIRSGERWRFDSREGAQEMVNRRIGRNEIAAIRTSLAYVDGQKSYFAMTGRAGTPEYAQRLVSTPGKHDGLYWVATSQEDESPLAALVAQAEEQGYPDERVAGKPQPYQGYLFRILKAQGENSAEGAKNYVVNGRMSGGFALVAWPASYGSSGIMTFIVNQDGVVFQKDLGAKTASAAASMGRFDPDLTWARVDIAD